MNWKDGGPYGLLCREITNETGDAVCKVWTKRYESPSSVEPWPEGEANFRLILNAPKMLEALEAIADMADRLSYTTATHEDLETLNDYACAAIAAVKQEVNAE